MKILLSLFILLVLTGSNLAFLTNLSIFNYLDEFLVVSLFTYGILKSVKNKRFPKNSKKLLRGILLFAAFGILSFFTNSYHGNLGNIFAASFLAVKFWLVVFSMSLLDSHKSIYQTLIDTILVAEKIIIFFAIINIIFPAEFNNFFSSNYSAYRFGFPAVCSLFNHPGVYGWFMTFCSIIHLSKFYTSKNKKELVWVIITIIFAIASLRAKVIVSMAAVIVAMVFLYIRKKSGKDFLKEKKTRRPLFLLIGSALLLLFSFRGLLTTTYELYFTDNLGVSARGELIKNSFNIGNDFFPLGVGFGKYGSVYASRDYSEYYYIYDMNWVYGLSPNDLSEGTKNYSMDTFWPTILGETGYLGLLIYFYLIIFIFYFIWISPIKSKSKLDELDILAMLVFIQTIVESFGGQIFNSSPQFLLISIVFGLAISKRNQSLEKNEQK